MRRAGGSGLTRSNATAADSSADFIAFVKSQLNIPEDLDTEDVVDFDNPSYWEGGDMWLVNCEFYYDGKLVATAMADQESGLVVRNIMVYTGE